MNKRLGLLLLLALAVTLPGATMMLAQQAGVGRSGAPARPEGPCDVYAAASAPCVAAHSSTRALSAAYNGPLYRVMRQSDGKSADIGVVQPSASPISDAGGYANAAAQDSFCADTTCWITTLYDQSGKGNHLVQAPRGGFSGPSLGGFNNLPIADMAPITIMGHKAYGVFIEPGMGLRWNNAKGTAVDDQAEGQYWVINGLHYNNGCCFDYGNAETDSRDDGNGTMETTYYGNSTGWYHGPGQGPWIMTDQENNLVGCVNPDGSKNCPDLPTITWRFVTAMAKGEPHHWTSMGGDAQKGDLQVMFDGPRINNTYDPMRKQGAILLGNGGDNSNGSAGTFYEGAMTAAGTFPSDATDQKVQANVVAAKYDAPRLSLAPASATSAPPGLQTFSPGSSQATALTFTNTTGAPVTGVELSLSVPARWTAVVSGENVSGPVQLANPGAGGKAGASPSIFSRLFGGHAEKSKKIPLPVAPGASVTAIFNVTAGPGAFNGDLIGNVAWTSAASGKTQSERTIEKVRSGSAIKINEFAVGAANPFIELYNAGATAVDISNWTVTGHSTQQAIFSSVKIPAGTKLAPHGFYLLGLSASGLAVPARKGDASIHVRSTAGMNVGDTIEIDAGAAKETRKIAAIGTAAGPPTTLWQPLPDGPVINIPPGSTNVPVASVAGFAVGEKIGLGHGATYPAVARDVEQYEVVTVTEVGKPGTQTALAADAKIGDTHIRVRSAANITAGDKITLDIETVDHGIETITVKTVPPAGVLPAPAAAGAPARGDVTARGDTAPTSGALRGRGGRAGRGGLGGRGRGGADLELAAPLKFNHAANMPLSVRGTGVTFQPPTAFAHSSNEPVQPLGVGLTLDRPLAGAHAINAVAHDALTTAGYHAAPAPNQWFGGPALAGAGAIVLRDAAGLVADSLNYGGLIDPWAAEGYQAVSGTNRSGCSVPSPIGGRGGRGRGATAAPPASRSAGRTTDGVNSDSNCTDFQLQPPTPGAPNGR